MKDQSNGALKPTNTIVSSGPARPDSQSENAIITLSGSRPQFVRSFAKKPRHLKQRGIELIGDRFDLASETVVRLKGSTGTNRQETVFARNWA